MAHPGAAIPEPEPRHGRSQARRRRHEPLLRLLATAAALLLLPGATRAFLPPSSSPHGRREAAAAAAAAAAGRRRAVVVVGMGGKWQRDPAVMQGVAELVKGFKKREHEQTETADRYLQDGMEAIKRLDSQGALQAFDTALRMDNETGLVWHHGAMLYYAGQYEAAVSHLDKVAARYEEAFEQPATEEGIWRAAALYRLHGPEHARQHVQASQWGTEKRPLLRGVFALFRGEADAGELEQLVDTAANHPYSSYGLYGNFYLGLYHDAAGDRAAAMAALARATQAGKAREEDVMSAFPRLHLALRERELFSG